MAHVKHVMDFASWAGLQSGVCHRQRAGTHSTEVEAGPAKNLDFLKRDPT